MKNEIWYHPKEDRIYFSVTKQHKFLIMFNSETTYFLRLFSREYVYRIGFVRLGEL